MKNILVNILIFFSFVSCKTKNINHIVYYNELNRIDSIYRFQNDTLETIKNYKKLFKNMVYTIKNV